MWQKVGDEGIDLAIVSEPYKVEGVSGWHRDCTSLAAIGVCPECPTVPGEIEQGEGFVALKFTDFTVYSCYISPNCGLEIYKNFLQQLGNSVFRRYGQNIIVAGDFNAKSEEWQSGHTDQRGYLLCEWADEMRVCVANVGNEPTCFHQGYGSRIDVIFTSETLAHRIRGWKVLDEESGSDHQYIQFSLYQEVEATIPVLRKLRKWAINKMNPDQLRASYLALICGREEEAVESVEWEAEKLVAIVTKACDSAMPRSGGQIR